MVGGFEHLDYFSIFSILRIWHSKTGWMLRDFRLYSDTPWRKFNNEIPPQKWPFFHRNQNMKRNQRLSYWDSVFGRIKWLVLARPPLISAWAFNCALQQHLFNQLHVPKPFWYVSLYLFSWIIPSDNLYNQYGYGKCMEMPVYFHDLPIENGCFPVPTAWLLTSNSSWFWSFLLVTPC